MRLKLDLRIESPQEFGDWLLQLDEIAPGNVLRVRKFAGSRTLDDSGLDAGRYRECKKACLISHLFKHSKCRAGIPSCNCYEGDVLSGVHNLGLHGGFFDARSVRKLADG